MDRITRTGFSAMLVAGALSLSGCGAILDRVEEGIEGVAAEQGQSIDIELGGTDGESCLPPSLLQPGGNLIASQGFSGGDAGPIEVCVSSAMYPQPADLGWLDDLEAEGYQIISLEELPEAAMAMMLVFADQAGLSDEQRDALVRKGLEPFANASDAKFSAHANGESILLVAASNLDGSEVQVTMGLVCEGSCG